MDDSEVGTEEACPAREEFSFHTVPTSTQTSGGDGARTGAAAASNRTSAGDKESTGGGEALHQIQEEMQANATGVLPPPDINNPAGAGEPISLPQQGINLTTSVVTTPVVVRTSTSNKHRRSTSTAEKMTHDPDGQQQTKGGATEVSGSGSLSGGRSSSYSRLEKVFGKSDSLSEVLGSRRLLKSVKPKSSPLPSGKWEGAAVDGEDPDGQNFVLKRVPSYSNESSSGRRPAKESPVAFDRFEPGRRRITILSMDGGGMRGLIAARCLAHLESLLQAKTRESVKLCDYFDFLAGTSTGAILTVMISTPDEKGEPLFSGQNCCEFYARNGREIFRPRWYDPWRGSLRQLYRPKFSPRRFEKLLKSYLIRDGKALTMRDSLRPFLVTSFDLSQAAPHIFVRQAAMKDDSRNFCLWEVCRGTASAPTYFRPAEVTSVDGKISTTLIDGGAIQNNPALVAMTHVLGNNEEFPEAVGLQDVLILSLGAGQLDEKFDMKKARKWGMAGWVRPLLNIMMDGSSDTIDYQLAAGFAGHNCSENYLRIQLLGLPNSTALMDCSTKENIQDLIQFTDDLLQEKAVMRNEYGEKVTLAETYAERLSWFADQLIAQKSLREQGGNRLNASQPMQNGGQGLGPETRMVSPMYSNLFMHQQLHRNGLSKPLETAKSVRF